MKTKMQQAMQWIAELEKDVIRIKMDDKRYAMLLWGFAKASAKRKAFCLTNGGFRFYWGHKVDGGWLNLDITFDEDEATIRKQPDKKDDTSCDEPPAMQDEPTQLEVKF